MADDTTPFHYAVYGGQPEMCRLLVQFGADPHSLNDHGCNAAQWAALTGSIAVLEFLVTEYELDLFIRNKNCHTILHKAAQRGHEPMCRWLLTAWPSPLWLEADKTGMTAGALALANGHRALAAELIQQCAMLQGSQQ